jgi:hypothetical protein
MTDRLQGFEEKISQLEERLVQAEAVQTMQGSFLKLSFHASPIKFIEIFVLASLCLQVAMQQELSASQVMVRHLALQIEEQQVQLASLADTFYEQW